MIQSMEKNKSIHKERWTIKKKNVFKHGCCVTLSVTTENNCKHKNLLVNDQWRAVDSIKRCEKLLPLK